MDTNSAVTTELPVEDTVVFRLGRQRYGLPVKDVVEVLQMVAITELPDLPPGMLGLINYRNDVMPLIDLRQVFGSHVYKIHLNTLIIVARIGEQHLAFIVDGVDGVESLRRSDQTPPDHLSSHIRYLSGVAKFGEELLLVVNLEALRARYQDSFNLPEQI